VVNVNFALIGANGDVIVFDQRNYVLNPDFIGFHIPPSQVRIEDSAGDGGVFRHAKRGIRNVDLPVTVLGSSRADVQTKLRRLAKLTQHSDGPLVIQAQYTDGTRLTLEAYYVGGAEGQWGAEAGQIWNRWVLQLRAPRPYWRSTTVQQFTVGQAVTGRGLLPQLSKLKVSSSQALGTIQIDNQGDVPVFPTYRITGPITGLNISDGNIGFSFVDPILAGETIFVNTETGEVTDGTGANRYSMLAPAPKLFRLPVGQSSIIIEGTAATDDTRIDAFYSLQFEVVH
jgi:hypothetical protein